MYDHSWATLCLLQAHGNMPWRRDMRDKLSRAVQLLLKYQHVDGGWRYKMAREGHSDTLVTDEPLHFTAGETFPVFVTPHGAIGVLICYDRRFPEAWRELALAGAAVVFMPACVPAWDPASAASSAETFIAELRTRACENLLYVVACNRVGVEEVDGRRTTFIGKSCILGPGGAVLAEAPTDAPAILRATLDLAEVERTRARLPLLRDRRPATYTRLQHEGVST